MSISIVRVSSTLFFAVMLVFQMTSCSGQDTSLDSIADESGFVVVELFTSQGCSSCPPADRLLKQLTEKAEKTGRPILALSFHVDYWNRLGWTDPYSHRSFSERQRMYARVFESDRIYTPQMIVNGRDEFVGSRRDLAEASIDKALTRSMESKISLQLEMKVRDSTLEINYRCSGQTSRAQLNLALVDNPQANKVERGENSGRTLEHAQVVRAFHTEKKVAEAGTLRLKMPPSLIRQKFSLVGYLQDPQTAEVLAADQIVRVVGE